MYPDTLNLLRHFLYVRHSSELFALINYSISQPHEIAPSQGVPSEWRNDFAKVT